MRQPTFLLINPWIYDFAAYDMWAKPMGLLYIASYLRERGARIRFWDALSRPNSPDGGGPARRAFGAGKFPRTKAPKPPQLQSIDRTYARYGRGPEELRAFIGDMESPDAILVTSLMTYWYPGVFEAIETVKTRFPATPVLLGGIYATLCEAHARANSQADEVLAGADEARVAQWLESRLGIRFTAPGADWEKLHPAFDLLAPLDYSCVLTSRGCPYACHYCASKSLYPGFTQREPEDVVEELARASAAYGALDVAFYDDALLVNAGRHIAPILEEVLKRGLPLRFHTPNGLHLRELNLDLAALMKRAGFKTIRLGFESADLEWHRETGGKVREGDLERALGNLRKAGFDREEVGVYVLVGLPEQRYEEAEEAVKMVLDMGARCFLSEYSPIPRTRLWDKALAAAPYDLAREPLFHNNSIIPCGGSEFSPERMRTLKRLKEKREEGRPAATPGE